MKTVIAALFALTAISGVAHAGAFGERVPGHIFVKADRNNDGVLNAGERNRAKRDAFWDNFIGG